ncbi:MAG: glutamyl-tRNA reductase [Thermoleophilaceae bacterium]|nr:glutamyl-tRNA reductase [Thermoleophilaceae bacterium]
MNELLAIGASHKTATLALRERLSLPEGRAASLVGELVRSPEIHEAVAVSTCNRTELYLVVADPVDAESLALSALARQAGIRPTELFGHLYSLRGVEAASHLFSVAAGLDSMIIGENEIQGQVRRAYELALVEGTTGPVSNRLFRDALAAGKRARTETGIGRLRVSVSSIAVELAEQALGDLRTRQVLVIGAGENGEVTARALADRGVHSIFVANRRYDRAIGLAARFGGEAVRFDDLPELLTKADIVVSCTASPHQIVGREELALVLEQRAGKPLLMMDIAVPRDIDPGVRGLPGLTLYDMDDLQHAVARNMSGREAEAAKAAQLVGQEVERFARWVGSLEVVPTITAIRGRGDEIVAQVLRENEGRWESLSENDRRRLEVMARAVVSRLLHEPTRRLKDSDGDSAYVYVDALRELFALEGSDAATEVPQSADVSSLDDARRKQSRSG